MCILFLYLNEFPKPGEYKLILASNRDEYYVRPTRSLMKWENKTNFTCFGGIDLEPTREGGTWLAVGGNNEIIKVGVLLNIHGGIRKPDSLGRGSLVTDFVAGSKYIEEYSEELYKTAPLYGAFNLVTVQIGNEQNTKLLNCSNSPLNIQNWPTKKTYGFGNSPPSNPYKKVQSGNNQFNQIVSTYTDKESLIENCMSLLKSPIKYWPDEELSIRDQSRGKKLSSIMVQEPESGYGTRTHSVILVNANNELEFVEETMLTDDPNGKWKITSVKHKF